MNSGEKNDVHDLRNDEILRYSRQLLLPEFGVKSQRRLKSGSVLIIGCGGLGCPAAIYLSAAGVGTLGKVDTRSLQLKVFSLAVFVWKSSNPYTCTCAP